MGSRSKNIFLRQTGFTLVEIMVGLVIGLLTTLVITQVFALFEGQKRTTTGSADAQTNGSIALFNIKRDVQMAGFGLPVFDNVNPPLRCDPSPSFSIDHDNDPLTANINIDMFPIRIVDGATAGASDSITVRYGQTPMGGVPVRIIDPANATNAAGLSVDNSMNCQTGDIVLVTLGAVCTMSKVTSVPDSQHIRLSGPIATPAAVAANASLACLGNWNEFTYKVVESELQRSGAPTVTDIVNIQAQYGISDAANSNRILQWVNASGATWAAPSVANRNRIKAVRIAVVARNGLLEKEVVTNSCTTNLGTVNSGPCAWDDTPPLAPAGFIASPAPQIDLSKNADGTPNPDWQRYRYRVFETIIPLRNMIWAWNTL